MTKTTTPDQAKTPLIGLTGRRRRADSIAGFPTSLGHLDIDLFLADYNRDVATAGGLPVLLPIDGDPAPYVDRLDGIVLTGGADLAPGHYGAEADGHGDYEAERDTMELALLDAALAAGLPVLGICRGLQLLNVHTGGTLHQHVPSHSRYDVDPAGPIHQVDFEPATRLHELYGESADVNSLHHQTVATVGAGLQVSGRAPDGTVEALELPDQPVIAVQWHPEMRTRHEPVFSWLVAEAQRRMVP